MRQEAWRWDLADWAKPKYSRSEVKRASKMLLAASPQGDYAHALDVVNNWRSSHSYPLQLVLMLLRSNAHRIDGEADVVRRMKRLRSIRTKLERTHLDLTQMQDLGGCRAVLKTGTDVNAIVTRLENCRAKHDLYDRDDYIENPKRTGYRSHHLMFKCRSDGHPEYNGLRIEVQVRTRRQHSWATAVETVGLFSAQDLKADQGDQRWLRFFALMGSEVARIEGTPWIPGTPSTDAGLRAELSELAAELDVLRKLEAYGAALKEVTAAFPMASMFLLVLDVDNDVLRIGGYQQRAAARAQADYERAETENAEDPNIDVVLVAADSVEALRRAYPNYFADTTAFRRMVERAIA